MFGKKKKEFEAKISGLTAEVEAKSKEIESLKAGISKLTEENEWLKSKLAYLVAAESKRLADHAASQRKYAAKKKKAKAVKE